MNNNLFHNNGKFSATDVANELSKHSVYKTDAASDTIYRYNGFCYEEIPDRLIENKIMQLCNFETCHRQRIETLETLMTKTAMDFNNLSQYDNFLNIKNGLFDVIGKQLLPRTSNDYLFYIVEIEYDPYAVCTRWEAFLNQIFEGNQRHIEIIQNMFGYCLLSGNFLHVCFILMGTGQNGKSTVQNVLRALLGNNNVSSLSMLDLSDKFRLISLHHKLANICDESPSKKQIDLEIFKNLVSGGTVTAEAKHKPIIQFKNTAKLIFSCNSTPLMNDATFALKRRLVIIPFNYQVKEEEKDPFLTAKLLTEMPGIFNWSLLGAQRVLASKDWSGLFYSTECEEAKQGFIRDNDSVKAFIDEICDVSNASARTNCAQLYTAYRDYCDINGYSPCASNHFGTRLRNYYPNISKKRNSTEARNYYYAGIDLATNWGPSYVRPS